ncbi:MAG: pyruvate kinase [Candidatus Omnitrophica bacterium]|nr:pyruvate kinase [Candidatus Omnitrophota bacterium]
MKTYKRHTKIIGTLGPASFHEDTIEKMALRGLDVVRINCSHGTEQQHQEMIDMVRNVNQSKGYEIKILLDLEGYRIRVGKLRKNRSIHNNDIIYMSKAVEEKEDQFPFEFDGELSDIKRGHHVFIDDGRLHLRVLGHSAGKKIKMRVIQGGVLKQHKGINIPEIKLQSNIMTKQDEKDLQFGINNKVEFIAQSFVRNRKDIQRVTERVKPVLPKCMVIAKIESQEGVNNLESILKYCDGLMVARGDLGVVLPLYKIPILQKIIIRRANRKKKFSMTATQMLESMITDGRPTRAEVSDVANAILDGSDYIMLSGETAVGKYPSRTIQVMRNIIEYTERYQDSRPIK